MPTVLITGASRGIGLELARHYSKAGAEVIATARDPQCKELQALATAHKSVTLHMLDVTSANSFDGLAAKLSRRPVDLLIANAGVMGPRGGIDDADNTLDRWADVLAVNVTGVFFTARALLPNLKAAGAAKIAILSTVMASAARAGGASYLYRASKAAAANVGANLAVEMKQHGIAVGIYHPGWVKTDMGGSGADITRSESVQGLTKRFGHLSVATTGTFENYKGEPISF